MKKIRILVTDDHAVVRAGLRMLINSQPDMEVVGEAADGREAIRQAKTLLPDIVLLDLSMPGMGGIAAVEQMGKDCPEVRVLVLTMHEDPAYLQQALKAGASGYLVKRAADTELVAAIRALTRGEVYVHSSLTGALLEMAFDPKGGGRPEDHLRDLSRREIEVLRLLALGHTNRQIADKLFLSVKTIETYRARLMEKLQVSTRAALVRFAMQHGLLSQDDDPR